jgi:hypothetical protein
MLAGIRPAVGQEDCDPHWVRIATMLYPPLSADGLKKTDEIIQKFPASADVVVLGDSLADGWPLDHLTKTFAGESVAKLGAGGDMLQTTRWRLKQVPAASLQPSEAVLIVGTNNLPMRMPACAIAAGLDALIQDMHGYWPQAEITVVDIPPREERDGRRDAWLSSLTQAFTGRRAGSRAA